MRSLLPRLASNAVLVFGLATVATVANVTGAEEAQKPVSIPFADLGAIRNFRPIGDEALLIEASGHRWFRATFYGRCLGLRSAENVAFMTEPGGSLDRFSAIYVDGHRCAFRSFEPTDPPAKKERAPKPKA